MRILNELYIIDFPLLLSIFKCVKRNYTRKVMSNKATKFSQTNKQAERKQITCSKPRLLRKKQIR